jgi:hypothetical protein
MIKTNIKTLWSKDQKIKTKLPKILLLIRDDNKFQTHIHENIKVENGNQTGNNVRVEKAEMISCCAKFNEINKHRLQTWKRFTENRMRNTLFA